MMFKFCKCYGHSIFIVDIYKSIHFLDNQQERSSEGDRKHSKERKLKRAFLEKCRMSKNSLATSAPH